MSGLLARHAAHDLVCFGGRGERDAAQLAAYAAAIAAALPPGEPLSRVGLACADRYHFAAGLIAIWQRGFSVAFPSNTQPETLNVLRQAPGVMALLHDRDDGLGLDVRALEDPSRRASTEVQVRVPRDACAVVAFTSGSTGTPVAHEKTLTQLINEPEMWIAHFGMGGRRVVGAVPPQHIYGLLFGVLMPLLGGGSMSRNAPLLPSEVVREIEVARADVLVAVPPHLRALVEHQSERWPSLHRVFSSAAPLPEATSRALAERGLRVTQVLGSTETGGIAYRESGSAPWCALPGVELVVDSDAALCVRSSWASRDPGALVRTADRVELVDDHGGFRHLGRADAVVKVGGRRVDLGDIEARLCAVEGVREARVIAAEGPGVRGAELWAVVEANGVTPEQLKRALGEHLDPVTIPRRFRVVAALPRTTSGKVTRHELLALFQGQES